MSPFLRFALIALSASVALSVSVPKNSDIAWEITNDSALLHNSDEVYGDDNAVGVAHCFIRLEPGLPRFCMKYLTGDSGRWCFIQPYINCKADYDCDARAPCYKYP